MQRARVSGLGSRCFRRVLEPFLSVWGGNDVNGRLRLVEIKRVSVDTPRDGKAMRMLEEQPVGGRRKTLQVVVVVGFQTNWFIRCSLSTDCTF
jgi:hypothetical protein